MSNENVINLLFIRAPNAMRTEDPSFKANLARPLSSRGVAQAQHRKQLLGNLTIECAGASHARRTMQAAQIIAGFDSEDMVQEIPELGLRDPKRGGRDKILGDALKESGYQTLDFYRRSPKVAEALDEFGVIAWDAIYENFQLHQTADTMLIVGYAVLLPAIAEHVAMEQKTTFRHGMKKQMGFIDYIRHMKLNEAGGFKLTFNRRHDVMLGIELLKD